MDDRLREIEGTLARTSERKNTILYKLSKRKAEEERLARLGLKKMPTNPRSVTDEKVAKFVLYHLKQEIGEKVARIRNTSVTDLHRDGEAAVRAKNDEINTLIARREQWERRLAELRGEEWAHRPKKKMYFGCAKQLPEATKTDSRGGKRRREDMSDGHSTSSDDEQKEALSTTESEANMDEDAFADEVPASDMMQRSTSRAYLELVSALGAAETDSMLMEEEKAAERQFRAEHPYDTVFLAQFRQPSSESAYIPALSALVIPGEEDLLKMAVDARKAALQKKLAALRERAT